MPELKFIINYYLDVGHTRVTAAELSNHMASDPGLALIKLQEWHGKRWIRLLHIQSALHRTLYVSRFLGTLTMRNRGQIQ